MEKPYPIRLNEAPIVEAAVEIRFDTSLPLDAVFGVAYTQLKDKYPKTEQLPVMQLPSDVREKDEILRYQSFYKLSGESPLSLGIGGKVILLTYTRYQKGMDITYPGWTTFIAKEATEIITKVLKILPDCKVTRLGIRYQDFFKSINIFEGTEPSFEYPTRDIQNLMIKTSIHEKNMVHNVMISNNANLHMKPIEGQKIETGSILDIDTSITNFEPDDFKDIKKLLTYAHDANKELFYETLTNDFISKLDPVYKN